MLHNFRTFRSAHCYLYLQTKRQPLRLVSTSAITHIMAATNGVAGAPDAKIDATKMLKLENVGELHVNVQYLANRVCLDREKRCFDTNREEISEEMARLGNFQCHCSFDVRDTRRFDPCSRVAEKTTQVFRYLCIPLHERNTTCRPQLYREQSRVQRWFLENAREKSFVSSRISLHRYADQSLCR